MNATFRLRRYYRNVGLVCLGFYAGIAVFSSLATLFAFPGESRLYAFLFFSSFWLIMAGISVWVLLAYWRYSLAVRDRHLVEKGVIFNQEIQFSEITEVRWRSTPEGGAIVLKTARSQVKLRFHNFEQAQRLSLIRFFRNKLPHAIQQDWPLFCYKVALPIREAPRDREPSEDEARFTRRRLDWYFLPAVIVAAVMGFLFWWTLGLSRLLAAPVFVAALWWTLRTMTPRQGIVAKRLARSEDRRTVAALLLGLVLLFPLLFLARLLENQYPAAGITAMLLLSLALFLLVFRETARNDRRRQEQALQAAPAATEEWDRQEATAS